MKRGLTLAGSIIGTVFSALQTVAAVYLLAIMFGALGGVGSNAEAAAAAMILIITAVLTLAFAVVCLILNALSIKGYKADPARYQKLRGTIIAAIVFNFLLIASEIYALIGVVDMMTLVIDILVLIALVAANVFMIVDLCLEKKRVQANTTTAAEVTNADQNQQ